MYTMMLYYNKRHLDLWLLHRDIDEAWVAVVNVNVATWDTYDQRGESNLHTVYSRYLPGQRDFRFNEIKQN